MMNTNKRKIGIMGGTFDPPHLGHLISAQIVAEKLKLDRVVFLPTGNFSYKDSRETAEAFHRYKMAELSVEKNPLFTVSDIETKEKNYSYTCYTLEKLNETYNDAHLFFIIGADSLDYIDKWKNPSHIFEQCTIAVVGRNGFSQADILKKKRELTEKFDADIIIVDTPEIPISSTDIRRRIRENKPINYFVCDKTVEYIKRNNLYRDTVE